MTTSDKLSKFDYFADPKFWMLVETEKLLEKLITKWYKREEMLSYFWFALWFILLWLEIMTISKLRPLQRTHHHICRI